MIKSLRAKILFGHVAFQTQKPPELESSGG